MDGVVTNPVRGASAPIPARQKSSPTNHPDRIAQVAAPALEGSQGDHNSEGWFAWASRPWRWVADSGTEVCQVVKESVRPMLAMLPFGGGSLPLEERDPIAVQDLKDGTRKAISVVANAGSSVYETGKYYLSYLSPSFLSDQAYRLGLKGVKGVALLSFDPERRQDFWKDRLVTFSGSTHHANVSKVMAHFTKDWLLHQFRYPPHLNRDNPHWTALVFRNKEGEYSWLGQRVKEIVEDEEFLVVKALETTLLKGFGNLSSRIYSLSKDVGGVNYDKDFLLNTGMSFLEQATKHFKKVNEVHGHYGQTVDEYVVRAEFGKDLHQGISADPRLTDAERREYSVDKYFVGVADDLLAIAFPNGKDDLEAPFYLKDRLWTAMKDVIIPNVLLEMYEDLLHPRMLDQMLLSALEVFNADSKEEGSCVEIKVDKTQRKLNGVCGELIEQVMTMIAPRLASTAFFLPGTKEKFAAALGSVIRDQLGHRWTIQSLLNYTIEATLPCLHQGKWEKVNGELTFVPPPKKSGKAEFSFDFPKNSSENREEDDKSEIAAEEMHKKVITELDRTMNKQIKDAIPNAISQKLRSVKGSANEWIEGYFGKPGLAVKNFFGAILNFFCVKVVGTLLKVLFYPITRFIGILIDKTTKSKSELAVNRLHMDINRNLLYTWTDEFLQILRKQRNGNGHSVSGMPSPLRALRRDIDASSTSQS